MSDQLSASNVSPATSSSTPPSAKQPDNMATELDRLVKQNIDLLASGDFADAEIVCDGRTWKVHKLILRSRCRWFQKAFANNWKEAQSGRIHLEEERPEDVNDVLRFIYSGRHVPVLAPTDQCVSLPVLENQVSLWRTADFFMLQDLKAEIQEYLLERFAATLRLLHGFSLPFVRHDPIHSSDADGQTDLSTFSVDFSKAVEKTYQNPDARELHKLFAVFACGLREHLPAKIMWHLMANIPKFRQDLFSALMLLHFPNSTNGVVASGLEQLCFAEAQKTPRVRSKADCLKVSCTNCGKMNPLNAATTHSDAIEWEVTFDPFSCGIRKWCEGCALSSIKSLLKTMVSEWPADAPEPV